MDFITIDFETATSERYSPCEIGLTFVKDGKIIETKSWLIKPMNNEFDEFNTLIHGIRPEHVANKPEFKELWTDIQPLIENQFLIAHNAAFDFSVLRMTLQHYHIPFPTLKYSCSYIFSKKVWSGLPSYDLKSLCKLNDIDINYHRAGTNSKATAELVLKIFEIADVNNANEIIEKLKTSIGEIYEHGYKPCESKRVYKAQDLSKIVGNPNTINVDSIFYGRKVVFTGALSSMTRAEAHQLIVDIGGIIAGGVTNDTDFLVVGQQDYRVVGDDGMSSKQEKAIKLIQKGSNLEVLSEDEFLRNL